MDAWHLQNLSLNPLTKLTVQAWKNIYHSYVCPKLWKGYKLHISGICCKVQKHVLRFYFMLLVNTFKRCKLSLMSLASIILHIYIMWFTSVKDVWMSLFVKLPTDHVKRNRMCVVCVHVCVMGVSYYNTWHVCNLTNSADCLYIL